jgi:uncharacterized membrane protein
LLHILDPIRFQDRLALRQFFSEAAGSLKTCAREPGAKLSVALFLLFGVPTTLLLALLVPPGEVADEPAHLSRAASLLRGELFAKPVPVIVEGKPTRIGGVICNSALIEADVSFPGVIWPNRKLMTRQNLERLQAIHWAKAASLRPVPNTAVYFPIFYIPAAAAVGIAKDLHLSPYDAVLWARVANALCFLLMGGLALLVARYGRTLLFAALVLPMTVSLAASCSQDGLLIATLVLAIAVLTRANTIGSRSYVLGGVLLALVIAARIPYFPFAAFLFLPLLGNKQKRQPRSFVTALRACLLVILPGILWAVINGVLFPGPIVSRAPYHGGPLWPGDPSRVFTTPDTGAHLQVLIHHPQLVVLLPLRDLQRYFADFVVWDSFIGRFGWMDVGLPRLMYTLWWIAIAAAILRDLLVDNDRVRPSWRAVILGVLAIAASFVALCGALYLGWTNVGDYYVENIQGRYMIPMLASVAVFLPAVRLRNSKSLAAILAVPVFVMAAVGMAFLPLLIVRTYYLA